MSIDQVTIDNLLQQYRISQRKPAVAMETQKTTLNARLNALSDLKTKLDALFSASKELSQIGDSSKFLSYTVSSSLTNVATATASSSASKGSHTLLVTQLAKADKLLSSRMNSNDASTAGSGTKTFAITVNGTSTNVDVVLDGTETNSSLFSKIAAAVNAQSGAGVTAAVVKDTSTTSRLVFTSATTGSENGIVLTDVTGTMLDAVGISAGVVSGRTAATPTAGGYTYASTDLLDAKFQLDGIDIIRGTNSVTDALSGVSFELKAVQAPTDTPVVLNVSMDASKIQTSIETFIKAYNTALQTLTDKTSVDPDLQVRQIFAGDSIFRNLRITMRGIVGGAVSSVVTGNPKVLSDIGITTNKDGTLALSDTTKFTDALNSDARKVSDLFNSSGGIAVQVKSLMDTFVKTGGQIETSRTNVNNQITSLTSQIKRFDEQLDKKVDAYAEEFARLQSAYQVAVQQQQTLQAILASSGYY